MKQIILFGYLLTITSATCGLEGGTDDEGCDPGSFCHNIYSFEYYAAMEYFNSCIPKAQCN